MSKINKHGTGYYTIEGVHYRGHSTESGQRLVPPDITVLALKRPGDAGNLDPVTVLRVLEQHYGEFGDPAADKVAELITIISATERTTGTSPKRKAKPLPVCD